MERLRQHLFEGIRSQTLQTIGAEIETQFVGHDGRAISTATSQSMLGYLTEIGWKVEARKGRLITALVDEMGNRFFYELGRHNIELATRPTDIEHVTETARHCLRQLYAAGKKCGARPLFAPIYDRAEDLLVIPDERDAVWLEVDGREALAPLARTSSVQFTFSVHPRDAIKLLNRLGSQTGAFLVDFPQDKLWRAYIRESRAGYREDRYGGHASFETQDDYVRALSVHDVVLGPKLVPLDTVSTLDVRLYLRSIWWHFRLKRYGDDLCIEVRPMPRREDEAIEQHLAQVLDIVER